MLEPAQVAATSEPREARFSSARARQVLDHVGHEVSLDLTDARLIRLGENALFHLPAERAVVRIARGLDHAGAAFREVQVSRWLASIGFPAVRALDLIEQPAVIDGHPVTFWQYIEEAPEPPTFADLGATLRRLHQLTLPADLAVPVVDVFPQVTRRIQQADIDPSDQAFLKSRQRELTDQLAGVSFSATARPLHGDAHVDNLMRRADGQIVLIDLEGFSRGPCEWDLIVTGTEHESIGWVSDADYADFVAGYGRDITQWTGYPVMRDIQEFKMTTWLMQNIHESQEVADEFDRRLTSLKGGTTRRSWRPY